MTDLIHIHTEVRELAPGDRLHTDAARGQLLRVTDGIVYVRRDDDDAVLIAGDEIVIAAGDVRRVWNAGDEMAHVLVFDRDTGCPDVALRTAAMAA
jgi:quercetin dioxygenase-like cupin family protein